MAFTLALYQAEFAEVKKEIETNAAKYDSLETNVASFGQHLENGSTVLGLRLTELANTGVKHDRIEPYLTDREVARIVDEMAEAREAAKVTGRAVTELAKGFADIRARANNLVKTLKEDIDGRRAKFTSRALHLNRAINRLRRLQIDGVAYRQLKSPVPLKSRLFLASRRGDPSAVVRHFLELVKKAARNFVED